MQVFFSCVSRYTTSGTRNAHDHNMTFYFFMLVAIGAAVKVTIQLFKNAMDHQSRMTRVREQIRQGRRAA